MPAPNQVRLAATQLKTAAQLLTAGDTELAQQMAENAVDRLAELNKKPPAPTPTPTATANK